MSASSISTPSFDHIVVVVEAVSAKAAGLADDLAKAQVRIEELESKVDK